LGFQVFGQGFVIEDVLDAGLSIVEAAFNCQDVAIGTLCGDHLEALDFTDALGRIEHDDIGAFDIGKSFQGCLAGVAGCGCEDADPGGLTGLADSRRHQMG